MSHVPHDQWRTHPIIVHSCATDMLHPTHLDRCYVDVPEPLEDLGELRRTLVSFAAVVRERRLDGLREHRMRLLFTSKREQALGMDVSADG